jgi:hypothetical protein
MYFPLRKYMTGPRAASRARPAAARAGRDAAAESICATCGAEPEPRRRRARSALTSGSTFRHGGRSRGDRCEPSGHVRRPGLLEPRSRPASRDSTGRAAQIRCPSARPAFGTERSRRYGQPGVSRSKRYLHVICARAPTGRTTWTAGAWSAGLARVGGGRDDQLPPQPLTDAQAVADHP